MGLVSSKQPQQQAPAQPQTAPVAASQYRTPPTQAQNDAFRQYLAQQYNNKLTPTQRSDYFKQQIAQALTQPAAQAAPTPQQASPQQTLIESIMRQQAQQQQQSGLINSLIRR